MNSVNAGACEGGPCAAVADRAHRGIGTAARAAVPGSGIESADDHGPAGVSVLRNETLSWTHDAVATARWPAHRRTAGRWLGPAYLLHVTWADLSCSHPPVRQAVLRGRLHDRPARDDPGHPPLPRLRADQGHRTGAGGQDRHALRRGRIRRDRADPRAADRGAEALPSHIRVCPRRGWTVATTIPFCATVSAVGFASKSSSVSPPHDFTFFRAVRWSSGPSVG